MATSQAGGALGTFFGSDGFPIEWQEGEKELFWILDDLHCPNPVSPLFFDIGGWWLTCDHMFRRFGTPFASDWIAKNVNGYVYTAAVPADPGVRAEATEYEARYVPRVPRDPAYAGKIGAYLGWVLPSYAENFLDWWRDRLRPELERNYERLDSYDTENATLLDLAILLEDAIDIHDRAWKIHWMLNFAQFSSTTALNATIEQVHGEADPALMGRLQSSVEDRNWDSIEDLWRMKGQIAADHKLRAIFERGETAKDVVTGLEASEAGRRFIAEKLEPHQRGFGYKAIWSHEFVFKTWVEDPAPIIEAVRGYLASDYDYPANIKAVADDLELAKAEVMEGVDGEAREELQRALDLSLNMNPLTPDHHFYIDQGANELVSDRRDEHEDAFERRPPSWVGTATEDALAFPYNALWGFPDKFYAGEPATTGEVKGLAASPGVIEGPARYVSSLDEFDQVEQGDILVCRMTNPAWVVLFTKISGLVTEAGGAVSHPAVVAREFGIPAVVGTTNAGERIKTGDRVRVNGSVGVVEILS